MKEIQQRTDAITLVISEVVEPDRLQEYEVWAKGINQAVQQAEGFLGVDVIRPRDHDYPEYVVIVKFDHYQHLRQWLTSSTYQAWMAEAHKFISVRSQQELPNGLELWFTLPQPTQQRSQPPFYKQVIVGVLAVYPLILLANAVLGPWLNGLHPLLGLLISVIFVSTLLTYPVMPWLTKLLNTWLYPPTQKRSKRSH
ncbi:MULTISPECIES: antibiotic biosynthesis monooxygenase [unclassified Leptolyngbya]|uniref:antibiotic biosynthesis monooxygenase n=1 Tax=unclassified Leptolyngbya TaxID=2650499 RepID=UPI001685DEED|nr:MULTISPECIES: antibiotic biosynthesis monooxygenase [unclassified Leptolyngbya]MBD1913269.1 antibiotic biosynthesis monooxygenase [Leptolyngbya sp. FACHB-8]MBD2153369.1 antibiotic biosynthesis monooxygenase [Leptolyngbya sp. FACHB-16]